MLVLMPVQSWSHSLTTQVGSLVQVRSWFGTNYKSKNLLFRWKFQKLLFDSVCLLPPAYHFLLNIFTKNIKIKPIELLNLFILLSKFYHVANISAIKSFACIQTMFSIKFTYSTAIFIGRLHFNLFLLQILVGRLLLRRNLMISKQMCQND